MGASHSALSIQNPSHNGPRTHAGEYFRTHGTAVPMSITAAGEESSAIRALLSAAGTQLGLSRKHVIGVADQHRRQSH
jgi:hypothetical protein